MRTKPMARKLTVTECYLELDAFYNEKHDNELMEQTNKLINNYDEVYNRNCSTSELNSVRTLLDEIDADLKKAGKLILRKGE